MAASDLRYTVPVRLQDTDAAGVVFFARVFEYLHDAYASFLDSAGLSIASILAEGSYAFPLVHAQASYAAPIRLGDTLTVQLAGREDQRHGTTIHYRVINQRGRLVAEGQTVHICVSTTTGEKQAPPAPLQRALGRIPPLP